MITRCYKCGRKFNCNPLGDCWCKNLDFVIKKRKINKKKTSCCCKKCLSIVMSL